MVRLSALVAVAAVAAGSPAAAAPNITGMWQFDYAPWLQMRPSGFHGPASDPVLTPWAKEEMAKAKVARDRGYVRSISNMKCLPPGFPNLMQYRPPLQILQAGPWITVVTEDSSQPRTIYMNRKTHPDDLDPSWNGNSIGHWEGDVLVVETVGFNDRGSLSFFDHVPRSEDAKIVERIKLAPDGKTLTDEFTIRDPKSLLEPWTYTLTFKRQPDDAQRLEAVCEVDLEALATVDLKSVSSFDVEARRMLDPDNRYNPGGR